VRFLAGVVVGGALAAGGILLAAELSKMRRARPSVEREPVEVPPTPRVERDGGQVRPVRSVPTFPETRGRSAPGW
jgi:hypothetical protein